LEYALGLMWAAHCPDAKYIEPFAVIGHSLGEFVAAVFSGSIECKTAAMLVCERGRLMAERPSCGSMLAVRTSLQAAEAAIASTGMTGRVAVACHNGPQSVVLSGDWAALSQLVKKLDLPSKPTRVSATHGDHSPLMAPMVSALDARAALLYSTAKPAKPTCHWVSTVSGQVMDLDEVEDVHFWGKHLISTVKYVDALKTVYRLCAERQNAPTSRFETARRVVIVEMGEGMLSRFGQSIAEDIIALDPRLRAAKVSFTQTLDRAEKDTDAAEYCRKVDARMEEVAVAVRKERLCRFLLSPHSVDVEPAAGASITPASMATDSSFVSVNSYASESMQSSNESFSGATLPADGEPATHRT
jgi:acyl transferase domain-containing protein